TQPNHGSITAASATHCLRPITLDTSDPTSVTSHSIHLGLLNACSIGNKSFSLNDLISRENMDIMCITETWQKEEEFIHLNELCPTGFAVHGKPRPHRGGGGLAFVHKEDYICKVIPSQDYSSFESQMVKVGTLHPLYCVVVYRPPGSAAAFLKDFSDFLSSIIKLEPVLILGDFNLHVDSTSSPYAMEFLSLTEAFNLVQHVSLPTHRKGHILDLVFALGLDISNVSVIDVHMSDHCLVSCDLHFSLEPKLLKVRSQRRIITANTAERFSVLFDPPPFTNGSSVDDLIQCFDDHCVMVLDQVAPVKVNLSTQKKACPWINEHILSFKRLCRKTERLWKSTNLEVHRLHLRDLISSYNKMVENARSNYIRQLVAANKKNPKVLFDTINSFICPAAPVTPVFIEADSHAFLNFFADKIKKLKDNMPPPQCGASAAAEPISSLWSTFEPVTLADVLALVNKTKLSSCSSDVIPCRLFPEVLEAVGPSVTEMINLSLSSGVFPNAFKHAIVEPLLKKGGLDPADRNSYRPISKLPFLSKILEKVVCNQLSSYLDQYNLFDKFQSGFRKHHSTETALLKVSSDIMMSADSGSCTVLVLLDLSSAFDTVDHQVLLCRLRDHVGLSGSVLQWFTSYLSGRSFCVSINQVKSESMNLASGVPQGSVLGPILFLLYLLPLGNIIQRFKDVSYHLYADDIQLYCSFKPDGIQKLDSFFHCLAEIKQWLSKNSLQLNADKTETLIFAPDVSIPGIKQYLGDLGQSAKSSLRNLGVFFDKDMSLAEHCKQLTRNCFFQLRKISKLRKMVSFNDLELIIHAFVSSRLDYCNSLFSCLNKKELSRLQLVQNSAARILTRTNRWTRISPILKELHWLPVSYRVNFKILVLTFRALHDQAPSYIRDLLQPYSPVRALRSADQNLLKVPRTRFKTRGARSFQAVAPRLWNDLPLSLRSVVTVDTFKSQLKTFLFSQAFA
uniref:Reverse transcriptase domain-containing protein n=1 Tax=Salarias fasciatus TaxID=181472 RepID=A0A672G1H3_SALFA